MFVSAMEDNIARIRSEVDRETTRGPRRVLDLGCWDGSTTSQYVNSECELVGIEGNRDAGEMASSRYGWSVIEADLNAPLPFDDSSFDLVTSNQVIEHLSDTDRFICEVFRVLRPGGLAVISTENLASWHNILALTFGWQAFSLTNVSQLRSGIGNPLANLRYSDPLREMGGHQRIFSYQGLKELAVAAGFGEVRVLGAGYYPLPSAVARIDPRHAAFISLTCRRP